MTMCLHDTDVRFDVRRISFHLGCPMAQSCSLGSAKATNDLGIEMIKVFEFFFSKDAVEQTMLGCRQCLSQAEGKAA
jgi:hypothetical protein